LDHRVLFVSQRFHGFDSRRTPHWQQRSRKHHQADNAHYCQQRQGIVVRDAKELIAHQPSQCDSNGDSDDEAYEQQAANL